MSELPLNQVLYGDCREVMKDFPDNSIDLVVTDPPYGLSFMGKDWDKTLPPKQAFEEMIRVLKPGALAFVMSSPRQDVLWRMLAMLEGVGFELTQSYIEWIYKTGFPKAYDVSKGIDNKFGVEPTKLRELPSSRKKRENVNAKMFGAKTYETKPIWNLAEKWKGWKSQTGLKPAHEPILMVNKPFSESTIVDNVLKWGTGAINVDACRIPFQNKEDSQLVEDKHDSVVGLSTPRANTYNWRDHEGKRSDGYTPRGRFPANLLVSDRAIDTGEKTGAGVTGSGVVTQINRGEYLPHNVYGERKVIHENIPYMDVGDQSRYFDLDAWAKHHGFLDVPKPDNAERDFGLKGKKKKNLQGLDTRGRTIVRDDGTETLVARWQAHGRNIHPTVKPIKLMAYLIELGCPRDGIVLDPFCGSGTTCIAAKQLVRKYVGIEIKPEYVALALARIEAYPVPLTWFGEVDVMIPPTRRQENEMS